MSIAATTPTTPSLLPGTPPLRKIAFDVDDTLCPYTKTIAEALGIPYESWTDFHTHIPGHTPEQVAAITQAYRDPSYYAQLEFYPGFSEIMQFEQMGAVIQFNSRSFTQDALDAKRQRMIELLPSLREEHFRFLTHTLDSNTTKRLDDDTFIAVDDSPYTIANSNAPYAIIPRAPWNQTPKALAMVVHRNPFYTQAGDLYAIYAIIKDLLQHG